MNLLLKAWSSDENYDADIGFVYVDLNKALVEKILKRMSLFSTTKAVDDMAWNTNYWCHEGIYLSHDKVEDELASKVTNEEVVKTKKKWDFEQGEHIECNQMCIDADAVWFTAIPKHTNIRIESARIPLDTLILALGKKKNSKKK
jgi:hypothetical protein